MNSLVIWFENLEADPERAATLKVAVPSKGMPEDWLNAIIGTASINRVQHITPGVLSAVVVTLKHPMEFEMFQIVLRRVAQKLGTNPWIRDYSEVQHREYFESGEPI